RAAPSRCHPALPDALPISALGRQVQRLESECGVRLFYRHGRGVTLTPEGRLYAERVRPLLQQLAQASEGLGSAQQPVTGSITLRSEEHTSELQSRENLVCR